MKYIITIFILINIFLTISGQGTPTPPPYEKVNLMEGLPTTENWVGVVLADPDGFVSYLRINEKSDWILYEQSGEINTNDFDLDSFLEQYALIQTIDPNKISTTEAYYLSNVTPSLFVSIIMKNDKYDLSVGPVFSAELGFIRIDDETQGGFFVGHIAQQSPKGREELSTTIFLLTPESTQFILNTFSEISGVFQDA